jgi:hypothetical protein
MKTDILKCVKELGNRVKWGIENLYIEMCKEQGYSVIRGIENSYIEMCKGTGLQSEMGD